MAESSRDKLNKSRRDPTPNDFEIGMWADEVLSKFPKSLFAKKPEVIGKVIDANEDERPVVKWHYVGVSITMSVGVVQAVRGVRNGEPVVGPVMVYAVQEIEENDFKKRRNAWKRPYR